MSKIDDIKAYVQANPGSLWWVEELTYRGSPHPEGKQGGVLAGAMVIFGVQAVEPDGETRRKLFGPYPVGSLPSEVPMGKAMNALQVQLQNTIDQQAASIIRLEGSLVAKDAEYATAIEKLAETGGELISQLKTQHAEQMAALVAENNQMRSLIELVGGAPEGERIAHEVRKRNLAAAEAIVAAEKTAIAKAEKAEKSE